MKKHPIHQVKVWSWSFYDWANSSFTTTVMAGFFPIFFKNYWSHGTEPVVTTARLGMALSVGSLLMAFISPTLGALADLRGSKKFFCAVFMLIGVLATGSLAFIPSGDWLTAMLAYSLAMMAFNASCVFYDSLLPFVAANEDLDWVSSFGYSLGYLGGGILFALNVWMYLSPETFGIADGVSAVKISFASVALWWLFFSFPLFYFIPEPFVEKVDQSLWQMTINSIRHLNGTVRKSFKNKNLFLFLLAFWLYIDGVYTVMTMAVDFGISLGFESKDLIAALLLTQFIGFPFAWLFGSLAQRWSSRWLIVICLLAYSLSLILATQMTQAWHFYVLAAVIGMVQGGVQSLSRSLFARMIPAEQSGEYFGLFNLVGKFASILGPAIVAMGALLTRDSRLSMLGLMVLFVVGSWLLLKVEEPKCLK